MKELLNKIADLLEQGDFIEQQYTIDGFNLTQKDAGMQIDMRISVKPVAKILCNECGHLTKRGFVIKIGDEDRCLDCVSDLFKEEGLI